MTSEITVRASDKPDITPAKLAMYEQNHPLDAFFVPKTVAVIGATEAPGSVGRTALWNLISNPFGGMVFPVNPNRNSVLGIKSYKTITEIPVPVDLAIIATPAHTTLGIVRDCVAANVKGAIILSSGFKEKGAEGAIMEQQILAEARKGHMRLLGPNCTGVMYTPTGFNAAYSKKMVLPGTVGFISQSGALSNAVLDWSLKENVGFSAFVTIGSMVDVGWGDIIQYLGNDHNTHSIIIYMETLDDVRSFLSATRAVALTKPVIVMKGGSSQAGRTATMSHTGALVGSDAVLDAAFNRTGVLRVNKISELFDMAEVLGKQPRPNGSRLTILTNAGAPGIIATDALVHGGGKLAPLSPELTEELNAILPAHWSHSNPIDIQGDATPERYEKAIQIALKNPESDGLLVILAPQAVIADPTETANRLVQIAKKQRVPILASWMGGEEIEDGQNILNHAKIPTYPYPDTGSRLFNYMWQYNDSLRNLYETPHSTPDANGEAEEAAKIIEVARAAGRTQLTEFESKQVLKAYGINTLDTYLALDEDEAVKMAEVCGYPVAVKLNSHTISHKSAVGGVKLNVPNAEAVREAFQTIKGLTGENFDGVSVQPMVLTQDGYELIVGSSIDPEFGPVILFGSGGKLVEIYNDKALGLPPLNTALALHMMEKTHIFSALKGFEGSGMVNLEDLEQTLVLFSRLVTEQRWIKEIDINPLFVSTERLVALDALIVLHDPTVTEEQLPRLAIRPYPTEYESKWTLKDGTPVSVRPIRPEDEPLVVNFHSTISERSVYFRYLHMLSLTQRVSHDRLTRICFIDYDREMALVAVYTHPDTGEQEILGIGRLNKLHGRNEAEFALLVSDKWQGRGLGKEFLTRLVQVGKLEGLTKVEGFIHPENMDMQRVSEKVGFKRSYSIEDGLVKVVMNL